MPNQFFDSHFFEEGEVELFLNSTQSSSDG
jgi:hypothetical protein